MVNLLATDVYFFFMKKYRNEEGNILALIQVPYSFRNNYLNYLNKVLLKLHAKWPASYGFPFITVFSKSTSSTTKHSSLSLLPKRLRSLMLADPIITTRSSAISSLLWTYESSVTWKWKCNLKTEYFFCHFFYVSF